ncbi:MAG: S8 family serine peptidase [Caldilineaceae bacterium]
MKLKAILLITMIWLALAANLPVAKGQDQSPTDTETDPLLTEYLWLPIVVNVAGGDQARTANDPTLANASEVEAAAAQTSVIVQLKDRADLTKIRGRNRPARQRAVIKALQAMANLSQRPLISLLTARQAQGKVSHFQPFWIFNGFEVTATADVIQELASQPQVLKITPNTTIDAPVAPASGTTPEPNLTVVNAPAMWDLGWRGQGVVIASMDSGVDIGHPDLAAQWRGGANSWYDPYGQHPTTPTDLSGHGTWTMGVMVGRDAGGTTIGVAPDAQWIAVKLFNDQGRPRWPLFMPGSSGCLTQTATQIQLMRPM